MGTGRLSAKEVQIKEKLIYFIFLHFSFPQTCFFLFQINRKFIIVSPISHQQLKFQEIRKVGCLPLDRDGVNEFTLILYIKFYIIFNLILTFEHFYINISFMSLQIFTFWLRFKVKSTEQINRFSLLFLTNLKLLFSLIFLKK